MTMVTKLDTTQVITMHITPLTIVITIEAIQMVTGMAEMTDTMMDTLTVILQDCLMEIMTNLQAINKVIALDIVTAITTRELFLGANEIFR
jgi:hypothetical protein